MENLRIFISSPGDVLEERTLAERVIDRLQSEFAGRVTLEPTFWEHEPLVATAGFQEQLVRPSETDIVISILWSRLGTRLPPSFTRPDGSRYESGTEFEFEDAAASYREKGKPHLLVYRKTATPLVRLDDEKDYLERLQQKKALDTFIDRWFYDKSDGVPVAAYHQFESPSDFETLIEHHLLKLIEQYLPENSSLASISKAAWQHGSPFRGLETFHFQHAPIFFGRTRTVADILQALREQAADGRAFVVVLGMSGGGKSSLVRAGVLPMLTRAGVIEGVGFWRRAVFRPSDSGGELFAALAASLLRDEALPNLSADGKSQRALAECLRDSPDIALLSMKQALSKAADELTEPSQTGEPSEARLVLVVDQMDEIFTQQNVTAEARQAFVATLDAFARAGFIWVIATLRSDFYPRCAELEVLTNLKEGAGQYDLRPPTASEIGQMIRLPARAAGLRFEEDETSTEQLDDMLRETAIGHPEVLPLLEFTLEELYQQRTEDGVLTFDAYYQLGGIEGSLAKRAETVFASLPGKVQDALPRMLDNLVAISQTDETISRKQFPRGAVATPEANALLDAFLDARLFVAELAEDGTAVVSVTHEALLQHWPRARAWINDNKESLHVHARIAAAAKHWQEEGNVRDLLLPRGKPLGEAQMLLDKEFDLAIEEKAFILASIAKGRRTGHLRGAVVAMLAVFAMTAGVAAFMANISRQDANMRRDQADNLVSFMLGDLRQRLEPIGRLDVLDSVSDEAMAYFASLTGEDITDETLARHALLLRQIGDVRMQQGNLAIAMEAFRQSLSMSEALAEREPDNPAWQYDLGQTYFRIGNVYWGKGDLEGATGQFEKYLTVSKKNADREPANTTWQIEISFANTNLGILLNTRGDPAAAFQRFRDSVSSQERALDFDPDNTGLQLELANNISWMGSTLIALGDLDRALERFNTEVALTGKLVDSDPENTLWKRRRSLGLRRVGELLEAKGDFDGALGAYQVAMAITRELTGTDPDNTDWQRDQAVLHLAQGRMRHLDGALNKALEQYRQSLHILDALRAGDETNLFWRRDLAQSRYLAGLTLLLIGDSEAAHADVSRAIGDLQLLIAEQPEDPVAKRYLAEASIVQGRIWAFTGDTAPARAAWYQAIDAIQPLAQDSMDSRDLNPWAQALMHLDDIEQARPAVHKLLSMGFMQHEFVQLCEQKGLISEEG